MGTIAKFKKDHPNLSKLSDFTLRASTVGDTIDVLVNAGAFISLLTVSCAYTGALNIERSFHLTDMSALFHVSLGHGMEGRSCSHGLFR